MTCGVEVVFRGGRGGRRGRRGGSYGGLEEGSGRMELGVGLSASCVPHRQLYSNILD